MRIHYLDNSGFALELWDTALVFDCANFAGDDGVIFPAFIRSKKDVLVFASHNHDDHFNPLIFDWSNMSFENRVQYFLSDDIPVHDFERHVEVTRLGPLQTLAGADSEGNPFTIRTFGSTDAGVSFYVEYLGESIFFAGDLNDWHWKGEANSQEAKNAHKAFVAAMQPIQEAVQQPSVAFFPADPRMKRDYDDGIVYFAKAVQPKLLVPMHFREHTDVPAKLERKMKGKGVRVWRFEDRGDTLFV